MWSKKYKDKEDVPIDGQTFQFEKGELYSRYIHYWQENPRLEGKAKDFVDDDDGTVNEKIFDLMYEPDNIRLLANQIDKDGGLRLPIWVGEDDDGKLVVYDGNRRYSAILHLQKTKPNEEKYKTIKAVLMEADGLTYVQRLAISTAFNTDGVKEWSPYAKAEMLVNLYENKRQEGCSEDEALRFTKSAMRNSGSVLNIKAAIKTHTLINRYKLRNDRFAVVEAGYTKSKHRKSKARIMKAEGEDPVVIEKIFIKTLKKAEKTNGENFNSSEFRQKIASVWKGSLESDEVSTSTWKDFLKEDIHLDDAIERFEVAQLGGFERKRINDFYDFVKPIKNQKKIITALYDDKRLRKKIVNLDTLIGVMLDGSANTERSKKRRKEKRVLKKNK